MNLLLFLVLAGVVSGQRISGTQAPVLDDGCDINDCTGRKNMQNKVPIVPKVLNNEKNVNDTNGQSQHRIMELELQLSEQKNISNDLKKALIDMNKTSDEKDWKLENKIDDLMNSLMNVSAQLQTNAYGHLSSGVYSVNEGNGETKRVYCEITADGGVWTRILHRQDNLTDFTYKNWTEYEAGFGDPQGSHWMGLVQMHHLTTSREYQLRVDLEDWEGAKRYAEYSTFRVGSASDKYRLSIDGYSGTAGDSMDYSNNMMFTTIDSDNDLYPGVNCADGTGYRTGGWWYNRCAFARLTGTYVKGGRVRSHHGIHWSRWRGIYVSYKVATMKIQRQ